LSKNDISAFDWWPGSGPEAGFLLVGRHGALVIYGNCISALLDRGSMGIGPGEVSLQHAFVSGFTTLVVDRHGSRGRFFAQIFGGKHGAHQSEQNNNLSEHFKRFYWSQ
jgi:hypothetical protein